MNEHTGVPPETGVPLETDVPPAEPPRGTAPEPQPVRQEPVEAPGDGQLPLELSLPEQGAGGELDDPARLAAAVEAVLFVVDTPVTSANLAGVFGVPESRIDQALSGLRDGYDRRGHGFALREVAEGWRLYTREEYAPYVERYLLDGQQTRLTQAALETLAVVAYRQPVTRSRIAAIRGVGVDGVMRTLSTRGLVEECGTDPGSGGNLYRTTSLFLERLGLRSLDELPSLAPLLPEIDALDDVATSA
ncbi:MAG TPA: SMC-Scp complex subunit ScpB [Mycobacteriales bacterium]|nr:SMC-Scp complex subunit ScpB [Mycobacteriales bacterium]